MRRDQGTNRRRIIENCDVKIAATSRLHRKPDHDRNDCQDNCAPHDRRDLFRTPAARRVVGSVVEFALHPLARPTYRKIASILSQSDAPSRSLSCFDRAGCAALTGSEAGKLSIRPASSLAWISRSALAASRGSAACLSCAAGLNFSAMDASIARITSRTSAGSIYRLGQSDTGSVSGTGKLPAREQRKTSSDPELRRKTLARSAFRPQAAGAAGLDDAAGPPLF